MAAEKLLSDRACRSAQPREQIRYLNDGAGLRLQIRPNGTKYWMFRYKLGGKESTYLIGTFPDVSLTEAREKAKEARDLVEVGRSPTVQRRLARNEQIEQDRSTFKTVAEEWLARNQKHWSAHHYERNKGLLTRILYPDLGVLPIAEITEPLLLKVLLKHYDAGIRESARRARGVAAQVFAYAKDTHRATHNPARELADSSVLKKPEVRSFSALKKSQVGPLMKALAASGCSPSVKAALLLMLYTGLRDMSLRGAKWREIDLEQAVWTVPAERMKRGKEHTVPLPRQAVAILTELANHTKRKADSYVFASYGKEGFLAENTLRITLHRLGFTVTAHGLRSLLTDALNEQGFNADAIERQLHHVEKDKVRAAYLRSDFFDYRRTMMQWWADWCQAQGLGEQAPPMPANVVQLRAA